MGFYALTSLVNALASSILGVFVYFKNRKRSINKTFALFCLCVSIWSYSYFIWQISTTEANALFWCRALMAGAIFIPICYLHFILELLNKTKAKKKILIFGYIASLFFFLTNFSPLFVRKVSPKLGFEFWPEAGIFYHPFLLLWFFYSLYDIYLLWREYKFSGGIRTGGIRKFQIKYALIGIIVGFIGGSTNYFLWYDIPIPPIGNVLVVGYVLATAYAILKYRLMDIRVAFGRVFVYLTSFFSTFVFDFAFLVLFAKKFGPLSIFSKGFYLLLSLFIALSLGLFSFFRKIFSKIASRYFYYSFYSVQQVVSSLSQKITSILEIDKLSSLIITTLVETFKLNRAVVLIRNPETGVFQIKKNVGFHEENGISLLKDNFLTFWLEKNNRPLITEEISLMARDIYDKKEKEKLEKLKDEMQRIEAEVCLPLVFQGKIIGLIVLGPKSLNEAYTKEDIELLQALSLQASIAFENAYLYSELKELSEHLQEKVEKQTKWLKELLSAKDEFLHIVSHQLRTPLTVLRGYLCLWKSEDFEKLPLEKRRKIRKNIIASVDRLHNIIKDILQIIDLEGGKMVFKKEKTNIEELVKKVYEMLRPIAEKKKISLELNSSLENPIIETDPRFLEIVLENVLDNAVKYTLSGKVETTLLLKENNFIIKVKDTGIGFSKEDKEGLFGKFIRGKRSWALNPVGSGLGLYIVKKIIDNLGGEIKVKSPGPNKGTEVEIILLLS